MNRKLWLIVPLLLAALLGACVPDDIYWLPDNRHLIAMRDRPMLIDTQDGTETPLALPGLENQQVVYFTARPDLSRLAAFTEQGVTIFDKRAAKDQNLKIATPAADAPAAGLAFIKRRALPGVEFTFGKLLSPSGKQLIALRDTDNRHATLTVWNIETNERRDIVRYEDATRDIGLQCYWIDDDRIAVIFLCEIVDETAATSLYNILGDCILHDLSTETTRTLSANLRFTNDVQMFETAAPDADNGRLILTNENRVTFLDLESGQQRHLYPFRMLEGEWPLYFTAIAGPRYNPGLDMMTFSGLERPEGGANIYEIDLGRTEELPINPFPWLQGDSSAAPTPRISGELKSANQNLGGGRMVRATPAVPLTQFRQMAAFFAAPSPRGDKLAYFINTQARPGLIVQRGERVQLVIADNRDEKLKLIADLNDKRERLFATIDDATRANDWAEWAVKIINDGLGEEDDEETN